MEGCSKVTQFTYDLKLKEAKTLLELKLIHVSQEIRSKPDWIKKIKNPRIIAKWKSEISAQSVTAEEFDYILDELKYYASLKDGAIEIGAVDGTWQSDELIDDSLAKSFKDSVFELLENVDESEKDFHPGSKDLVVDLVHPSLFCFVRGVSKIVDETGIGPSIINELSSATSDTKNSKYSWLPSEISSDENGKVSIDSYINNLPPIKNAQLYSLIAVILSRFLPLFSRVLSDLAYPRRNRITVDTSALYNDDSFEYDEDDEGDEEEQYEKWDRQRVIKLPAAITFEPPPPIDISDFDLRGQKLQVIVKLANIELTPRKPKYKGGVWHVEGTESEAIVATGIYYYSMENITKSRLKFRQAIDEVKIPYRQNDHEGVYQMFGMENGDPLNQRLGNIIAREGRCVVFPNTYQHKVAPFELIDKKKNGHRKILVFFLIDPTKRIISTRNVAPQNPIWDDKPLDRFTMTLDDAKEYREDLMSERKYIRNEQNKELYMREFSLCEH